MKVYMSLDVISFTTWSIFSILETPEHIKNYRPKILVMTGNPAHRPPLVNFANLLTKNTSLLLCGHVLDDPRPVNIDSLKNNVQLWLKDHKVSQIYNSY
jgi:solute carrier family 12 sodium/potassium/chloride transporter 2